MKKVFTVIIFFILILTSIFIYMNNKIEFKSINYKEAKSIIKKGTGIIYVNKSQYENNIAKIKLKQLANKNNVSIYTIDSNKLNKLIKDVPLIIFVKNGEIIYSYKTGKITNFEENFNKVYFDICNNKSGC